MTLEDFVKNEHPYYCSGCNYYVGGDDNFGRIDYDRWSDFYEEWHDAYNDYNLVFRYDLKKPEEQEMIDEYGEYYLEIFYMLQRKGIFRPVVIRNITENDIPQIEKFLKEKYDYLIKLWSPFNV